MTRDGHVPSKGTVAVFVSGEGTNLQALLDFAQHHPDWPAQIALVVSDQPQCVAVRRATEAMVPVFVQKLSAYPDKQAFETEILHKLKAYKVEWLVLAGYMRLIGPVLLNAYPQRILNIHPSLLPAFPGRNAVKDALAANVPETGVTVHYVDAGVDTGPIIAQRRVPVSPGMTEDELLLQLHALEHALYPQVVGQVVDTWTSERTGLLPPEGRAKT